MLQFVEKHPWWSLVFLVVGGNIAVAAVRAARGEPAFPSLGPWPGSPETMPPAPSPNPLPPDPFV